MADSEHSRPTVRDVARAAQVSVATVPRAFAKPDEVSVETHRRVVEIAQRMGYRFDFRRGSTRTVIVLVTDITNSSFSEFSKGIEEEARSRDFMSLMGDTSGDHPRSEDIYVAAWLLDAEMVSSSTPHISRAAWLPKSLSRSSPATPSQNSPSRR